MKYIKQNPLLAALLFSSASSVLLLILRLFITYQLTYAFLFWNLFLAWLPLIFAVHLEKSHKKRMSFKIASLFFMWLIFFPNAPYIITDLVHLKERQNIPLWFDIVLIMSFAWTGLIIGFISLLKIQAFLIMLYDKVISWLIFIGMLILSGFGVYLGRFLRWNTWDIITNPFALLADITDRLFHPFSHPQTVGVTVIFSFFLISGYLTVYVLNNEKRIGS